MAIKNPVQKHISWGALLTVAFTAAFFYVLMEWVFTVTKPSYMNVISPGKQVEILLFIGTGAALVCVLLLGLLALFSQLPGLRRAQPLLTGIGAVLPALVLAAAALLLIDNFTYTLFRFGIVNTTGVVSGLYAVGFFGLTALLYFWVVIPVARWLLHAFNRQKFRMTALAALGSLVLISLALPFLTGDFELNPADLTTVKQAVTRPNILLITSDGVNAVNMSAYGYSRDTTPNLTALLDESLVAENHFTNSGNTAGSIVSILTGKYPANTRVLYPPYILTGVDSYQHLPGILRTQGYKTIQIGSPHFVDAYAANMKGAFDIANNRTIEEESSIQKQISRFLPDEFAYFVYETANRIADRLLHIFLIKQMENPYLAVTDTADWTADTTKFNLLLGALEKAEQPLFIQVHFLGTHGEFFEPVEQIFSAGKDVARQESWDTDFYDDSIHDFDWKVGYLLDTLEASGKLENTILVFGSDHGLKSFQNWRIPLIIRFPGQAHAGKIYSNTQNIDIAPTILDFLGIDVPQWVDGHSLIDKDLPEQPAISVAVSEAKTSVLETGLRELDPEKIRPPFYQINFVDVMGCKNWYSLDLTELTFATGDIEGYMGDCSNSLSNEQALNVIIDHLNSNGYDTTSLSDTSAILNTQ